MWKISMSKICSQLWFQQRTLCLYAVLLGINSKTVFFDLILKISLAISSRVISFFGWGLDASLSLSLSLSLSRSLSLALSLSISLSLSLSLLSLSLSLSLSVCVCLSLCLSFFLSFFHSFFLLSSDSVSWKPNESFVFRSTESGKKLCLCWFWQFTECTNFKGETCIKKWLFLIKTCRNVSKGSFVLLCQSNFNQIGVFFRGGSLNLWTICLSGAIFSCGYGYKQLARCCQSISFYDI